MCLDKNDYQSQISIIAGLKLQSKKYINCVNHRKKKAPTFSNICSL